MIIDIILDRREGAINYVPATHLKAIYDYATFFRMNNLAAAVDGGTEDDVKAALMDYVISGGCNPDIHHHNHGRRAHGLHRKVGVRPRLPRVLNNL